MSEGINPRFELYCKYSGQTTDLEKDRKEYPGGHMCGYMLFLRDMKARFAAAHPDKMLHGYVRDHKSYTQFIKQYVDEQDERTI